MKNMFTQKINASTQSKNGETKKDLPKKDLKITKAEKILQLPIRLRLQIISCLDVKNATVCFSLDQKNSFCPEATARNDFFNRVYLYPQFPMLRNIPEAHRPYLSSPSTIYHHYSNLYKYGSNNVFSRFQRESNLSLNNKTVHNDFKDYETTYLAPGAYLQKLPEIRWSKLEAPQVSRWLVEAGMVGNQTFIDHVRTKINFTDNPFAQKALAYSNAMRFQGDNFEDAKFEGTSQDILKFLVTTFSQKTWDLPLARLLFSDVRHIFPSAYKCLSDVASVRFISEYIILKGWQKDLAGLFFNQLMQYGNARTVTYFLEKFQISSAEIETVCMNSENLDAIRGVLEYPGKTLLHPTQKFFDEFFEEGSGRTVKSLLIPLYLYRNAKQRGWDFTINYNHLVIFCRFSRTSYVEYLSAQTEVLNFLSDYIKQDHSKEYKSKSRDISLLDGPLKFEILERAVSIDEARIVSFIVETWDEIIPTQNLLEQAFYASSVPSVTIQYLLDHPKNKGWGLKPTQAMFNKAYQENCRDFVLYVINNAEARGWEVEISQSTFERFASNYGVLIPEVVNAVETGQIKLSGFDKSKTAELKTPAKLTVTHFTLDHMIRRGDRNTEYVLKTLQLQMSQTTIGDFINLGDIKSLHFCLDVLKVQLPNFAFPFMCVEYQGLIRLVDSHVWQIPPTNLLNYLRDNRNSKFLAPVSHLKEEEIASLIEEQKNNSEEKSPHKKLDAKELLWQTRASSSMASFLRCFRKNKEEKVDAEENKSWQSAFNSAVAEEDVFSCVALERARPQCIGPIEDKTVEKLSKQENALTALWSDILARTTFLMPEFDREGSFLRRLFKEGLPKNIVSQTISKIGIFISEPERRWTRIECELEARGITHVKSNAK